MATQLDGKDVGVLAGLAASVATGITYLFHKFSTNDRVDKIDSKLEKVADQQVKDGLMIQQIFDVVVVQRGHSKECHNDDIQGLPQ